MSSNYNEETVRAFKSYITKVIQHSAIDYVRKINNRKYTEIALTEAIDISVSLSSYDEGTFVNFDNIKEIKFNTSKRNKAFKSLTKNERLILIYTAEGLSDKEIAEKLKTTDNSIRVQRNKARKKLKKKMEN